MNEDITNNRPVLVIGRQRSGTTVLRRFVASSGQYEDLSEIFHGEFLLPSGEEQPGKTNFFAVLSRKITIDRNFIHPMNWSIVFDEFFDHICTINGSRVVIDVKYNMLNLVIEPTNRLGSDDSFYVLQCAAKKNAHIIHLTRKNVLHSLVSERIATLTNQWGATSEAEIKSTQISLNPYTIIDEIKAELGVVSRVKAALSGQKNVIDVDYSNMFDENGDFSEYFENEIAKRLGVSGLSRRPELVKQNRLPMSEAIINFDEIREALACSRYSWMLE